MRNGLLAALVLLIASTLAPATAHAAPGELTGSLPANGGTSLVVWGGGSTEQVRIAAQAKGCTLGAAWVLDAATQEFIGNVYGAPAVVNTKWAARFPGDIAASTLLILVCRAPQAAASPPAAPQPVQPGAQSQERELSRLLFSGVNAERAKRGLAPFTESATLVTTAEQYAPKQLAAGRLDHAIDGTEPWDRARANGYPSFNIGEVLAARIFTGPFSIQAEAPKFVQMWMDSPPHRSIIMTEDPKFQFTEAGYGCAISTANGTEIYCVGVTGRP
jgi:uncharacterized protein YkwD